MNILIIGSGGREHALAWKIRQSPTCEKLYIAPGNAGTALEGENVALNIKNNQAVVDFAKEKNIGLVVVAPDEYLAQGMADALEDAGIPAFGPTKAAARLEWSKAFAKEFMQKHGIPTAKSETFTTLESALQYVQDQSFPVVIKADGLALGKGVVIAYSYDEAEDTLRAFIERAQFGNSGTTVVIEEFLTGKEISVHAFCDGEDAVLFPIARDHKQVGEGNTGPNTGGMGTIAPIDVPESFIDEVKKRVVLPVVRGMKEARTPFKGILFPGLMVTKEGIKVLEFNARFGDPECESYMRLLESDIVEMMFACIDGRLADTRVEWSDEYVATVMLASKGYPGEYRTGFSISGLDNLDPSVVVFHAGTKKEGETTVTNGGRVLGVSAVGDSREEARARALKAAETVTFEGKLYRTDIGADWGI